MIISKLHSLVPKGERSDLDKQERQGSASLAVSVDYLQSFRPQKRLSVFNNPLPPSHVGAPGTYVPASSLQVRKHACASLWWLKWCKFSSLPAYLGRIKTPTAGENSMLAYLLETRLYHMIAIMAEQMVSVAETQHQLHKCYYNPNISSV